ncbi:hypothetical protein PAXINDRAFT_16187 [Paxillus involutus ATCC 200175]|uniref:Uncharacterized protein n=1 Tax=Paxillus involutus ATCC 200175 TaxID=664439 RepID=A0A0C9TUB5_PAXIN|nr:hypothetical protein PAXINDRAFT_16187 [Paxillus involutus ATCC 200175]
MSHQQVMSYLIGGGDHYKSHTFAFLNWDRVTDLVTRMETRNHDDHVEDITVIVDKDKLKTGDNILDYRLRSSVPAFAELCMWRYVEVAEKISLTKDTQCIEAGDAHQCTRLDAGAENARPGQKAMACGRLDEAHPQHNSHTIRLHAEPYVVVLSGRHFPRSASDEHLDEEWCHAMLILFKPWQHVTDLCMDDETWMEAFHHCHFSEDSQTIMANLHVENECEDARREI